MVRVVLSAVVVLIACASDEAGHDPIALRLSLVHVERDLRPTPATVPRTFIDGVERSVFEVEYTSPDDVTKHIVELRYSNTTAIRTLPVSLDSFGDNCKRDGEVSTVEQTVCVYDSGDLRFGSETVDGTCVSDVKCRAACLPLSGCSGGRCTSLITSFQPLASHLGCAPIGDRRRGELCDYIATPEGQHDNCGEHLLCVNGRCRSTCGSENDCLGCANLVGHAIEMRVCPQ